MWIWCRQRAPIRLTFFSLKQKASMKPSSPSSSNSERHRSKLSISLLLKRQRYAKLSLISNFQRTKSKLTWRAYSLAMENTRKSPLLLKMFISNVKTTPSLRAFYLKSNGNPLSCDAIIALLRIWLSKFLTPIVLMFLVDAMNTMIIEVMIRVQQKPKAKKEKTRFFGLGHVLILKSCSSELRFELLATFLGGL